MILPLIASSQSRRATAAGSPNRSITRRRASIRIRAPQELAVVGAGQVVGQLVEDVLAQPGRLVIPGRGQIGGKRVAEVHRVACIRDRSRRTGSRAGQASPADPQHAVDARREAQPRLLPRGQLGPAGVGQLVILPPAAVGLPPGRPQQLLPLQPVQRRVQRAFLQLEVAVRTLRDRLRDLVAVGRPLARSPPGSTSRPHCPGIASPYLDLLCIPL